MSQNTKWKEVINLIRADNANIRSENARLRAALEAVEWVFNSYGDIECAWCHCGQYSEHKQDCGRQAALGLTEATK